VGGSVTSTKNFVWCGNERCEQRDSSRIIIAQFFGLGETVSGSDNFYTPDHLGLTAGSVHPFMQLRMVGGHPGVFNPLAGRGSTHEITNSSGVIQCQLAYDPFGRVTQLQGSISPDFQFAGYYFHSPSGLALTRTRPYASSQGRWINRDPIGELGGVNLFDYVRNNPVLLTDHLGLCNPVPATCSLMDPETDRAAFMTRAANIEGEVDYPEPNKERPPVFPLQECPTPDQLPWQIRPFDPTIAPEST
jgi:RHS repeat-associated protein